MKLYRVNTDSLEDAILTKDAYKELRLQLSTSDFHMHTAELIENPTDDELCDAMYWDDDTQAFMSGAFG